ncbi:MAG: amino acid adenylation domain-containing protein, partial [Chloroflexi bacterium]|nr:amino acid adenylation domain-containing protein [Chloroflexota bacterium]
MCILQQSMSAQPYRAQCAVTLTGPLNSTILRATLEDMVERYEILRTTFPIIAGMSLPLQVIADTGTIAWTEVDLASVAPEEQRQQTAALFEALRRLPLDLAQEPPLHATLIRYAPESHALLLMLPALSADAAALQQLVARLIESYAASMQGSAPTDEPFQYADIAQWQNELLESPETAAGGNHWRNRSRFVAAPLLPPFAEIQTEAHDFQPTTHAIALDAAMLEQIAGLDAQPGLDSALLLLTCWQVLLWRLSDQPDLALGVVDGGRKYDELADAIGLIAKHLPLATTVQPQTRLRDLAAQNAEALQANAQWQEYFTWDGFPLEQAYLPYSFEFVEQPGAVSAGELTAAIERLYASVDRFKLKLSCTRQTQTLSLEIIYDSAAFTADTIRRLSDCLLTVISSALANLDAPVGALAIVSEPERQQLLGAWSVTPLPATETLCIHEQFAQQVQATPERVAAVELDQSLTFAELNAHTDQLARHLRGLGVGPEVIVGLYLEPSLHALTGILAILKAGAAYLPIDPGYPAERIAFMLADAQAAVVLTQTSLQANLSADDLPSICLDSWQPDSAGTDLPPAAVTVDNLAYVIYTSGSTGQPKGVAVTHRAAANFQHGMQTTVYDRWITQPVQTTLNAPLSFDASIQSLMLLVNGHTLHLLPNWLRQDNQALLSYLHERRIELITGTPTQIQLLVNAGLLTADEHVPTLALVAGEAVTPELWAELARAERTIFQNNYGPTECTVNTTSCTIAPDATEPVIGRPLANYELYILDQRMQLVPVGMSGELYVGGPSIARGYLNRPALTAEKFVPNPFGHEPGARLYRTGDLAHFLADGAIAFDGRIDQQVK